MKKLLIIIPLLLLNFCGIAQGTWTYAAPTDGSGNAGAETGKGICTDANGNVYVVGVFTGASDFDLNASFTSIFTASGTDGYVASYDKNGAFRWKVIIGGVGNDFGAPSGAICTNGTYVWFTGIVNMGGGSIQIINPGLSTTVTVNAPATNGSDALVGKLNCSNGAIQWGTDMGTTGTENAQSICVDPNGCCYIIGAYTNSFTLNGVTAPATYGGSDLYIAKFSTSGALLHFAHGGTTGSEMSATSAGICYVPGASPSIIAVGSCINGPTATYGSFTVNNLGGNDGVLVELDSTLVFTNALGASTGATDELISATYDSFSGDVFVLGYSGGASITLPGTSALTLAGAQDIIVARYSAASNSFVWSRSGGGTGIDVAGCITSDGLDGIFITGSSTSASPVFGSVSLPANLGLNDLFVVRYNTSGTSVWGIAAGGTGGDDGRGVASYVQTLPYSQSLFITGNFQNTATYGAQPVLVADGGNDFFLAKINDATIVCPTPTLSLTGSTNVLCNGGSTGSATVSASGGSSFTYTWSPSGGNLATASGLSAGNYTCVTTNSCGLTASKTVTITQPASALATSTAITNVLCNGGSTGSATLTTLGGTPGYSYLWSSAQTTSVISGLNAGVRTVTVTDANGCTSSKSVTITQPSVLSTSTAVTNALCNGGTGSATITASGGTGSYTYLWSTAATTSVVSGLPAGVHSATVTDANSCTSIKSISITQPPALTTSTAVTNVLCNGGSTGSATVTASGGTGAYTYLWSSAQTTSVISSLNAGVRTVTVTDANNCTSSKAITITQPAALNTSTALTNISCNGGNNGSATVTASGGTGAFTYLWSTSATTSVISGQTSGIKTVTVTDANNCTSVNSVNITQPTAITASQSQTNISCNGGNNGFASVNASGGIGSLIYNWSPSGGNASTASGLSTGNYTCTITDANSCSITKTFTITQPTSITATQSQTNITCSTNGMASVNASGGTGSLSYNWSPTGGTGATSSTLSVGNYSCTITDANLCSIIKTFTITGNTTPPTVVISGTNAICNGQSVLLTASGANTYSWSTGPVTTTISPSPTITTSYSVVGTNTVNGCSASTVQTVTVNVLPVIAVNSGSICAGNSFTIIPSGANTYTIQGGSAVVSPLSNTSYTVSGTSTAGCVSANTATSNVIVIALPLIAVNSGSICSGDSFIIVPSGANTYTIQGGSALVSPTTASSYTVTGTNTAGCVSLNTATCNITVNTTPTLSMAGGFICPGNSFTLNPTGANTYTYLNGGPVVSPTVTTTYSVSGTSIAGCAGSNTALAVVTVTNAVTVVITGSNTVCSGQSITLSASGASTYTWSTGSNSANISPTPSVNTTYSIIGASGSCTNSAAVSVTVNPLPIITASTNNSIICVGQSATLTAGGATTYSWSSGGTSITEVVSPTLTTSYTVTGTDANGCSDTTSVVQNVSLCTGIPSSGIVMSSEVETYPNPTNGKLTLIINENFVGKQVQVYNTIGELVLFYELRTTNSELDLTHQPNGIYFIRIGSLTKKIIKQ